MIKPLLAASPAHGLISITISREDSDDDDDEASSRLRVADVVREWPSLGSKSETP